jgi:ribosomal protein S18 acetylase RimI-like enzyme
MTGDLTFRMLRAGDLAVLERVVEGVFDHPIDRECAEEFLADPRLHIAVAISGDLIVGFASAVDYVHPDKPRELWINEVGVAPNYRRSGIGKAVIRLLLAEAEGMGCTEAWVLTDAGNQAANAMYRAVGGKEERPGQRMYAFRLRERS